MLQKKYCKKCVSMICSPLFSPCTCKPPTVLYQQIWTVFKLSVFIMYRGMMSLVPTAMFTVAAVCLLPFCLLLLIWYHHAHDATILYHYDNKKNILDTFSCMHAVLALVFCRLFGIYTQLHNIGTHSNCEPLLSYICFVWSYHFPYKVCSS